MNSLISTIQELSGQLDPIPTDTALKLPRISDIRCVLFDVYGTLMVSGVGDISHSSEDDRNAAIRDVVTECGFRLLPSEADPDARLKSIILRHQDLQRRKGTDYPEVDIREVWLEFLPPGSSPLMDTHTAAIEDLSIRFELKVNPTWPMPQLARTLESLREAGLLQGIVSNAQFFTPMLFEAYLEQSLEILGFTENLCQWSYAHKVAKPSRFLYQLNADILLKHHQIHPQQVLYVGNDMLNDITPARSVGFKTALFAGDKRSLRLRKSDPRTLDTTPDLVIDSLPQILSCIR